MWVPGNKTQHNHPEEVEIVVLGLACCSSSQVICGTESEACAYRGFIRAKQKQRWAKDADRNWGGCKAHQPTSQFSQIRFWMHNEPFLFPFLYVVQESYVGSHALPTGQTALFIMGLSDPVYRLPSGPCIQTSVGRSHRATTLSPDAVSSDQSLLTLS